jgi:hypothetical protein
LIYGQVWANHRIVNSLPALGGSLKGVILKIIASLAATLVLAGTMSHAVTVNPVAYDTQGVGFGAYYQDDTYSGSRSGVGQQSYAGGLGQLTDGFIATENYTAYENVATPGGPYVAWVV